MMVIRPIRPEDEPAMVRFHGRLSDESVFLRYAGTLKLDARVAHRRLARICHVETDRELVLVALEEGEIVAVARLMRLPGVRRAEFALLVSDAMQGRGLGRALLLRLIEAGRAWGLDQIVAEVLPGNARMRRLCGDLGFRFRGETGASLELRTARRGS